jgi:hypothetical protein
VANVSVGGPIVTCRCEQKDDELRTAPSPDQLWTRELAERAAAKATTNVWARRAHQELAQLCAAERQKMMHPNG